MRVIHDHGLDTDHDAGEGAAQLVHAFPGGRSGDPLRFAGSGRDLSVQGHRCFHDDEGFFFYDVFHEYFIQTAAFFSQDAGYYFDAGSLQFLDAASGNQRIRIQSRDDNSTDFLFDDFVGAGRCFAEMGAGFQSHIDGCTGHIFCCRAERVHFSMAFPDFFVVAGPDDASVLDDDGADHRIRGNGTAAFLGKSQRHLHKVCILILHLCVPPISKIKSPEHFCFRARQRKAS